jgi:hypothetical protein
MLDRSFNQVALSVFVLRNAYERRRRPVKQRPHKRSNRRPLSASRRKARR